MALIIEDGTGKPDAEAFADAAAYKIWYSSMFGATDPSADPVIEAAIRRSVLFLDSLAWVGTKANGRGQSKSWPRSGASDASGFSVESNEIPVELIAAQHFLTKQEIKAPGSLSPTASPEQAKVLVEAEGIKWKPLAEGWSAEAARTKVGPAMDLIKGFLVDGGEASGASAGIWSL